ncbi:MAG: ATP-binding protein [Cytophagales bacterium]
MKLTPNKVTIFIQGNATNSNLEHRVFNVACFCSAILNLLSIFVNFFIEAHYFNLVLPIFGFFVYSIIFFLAKVASNHKLLLVLFVLFTQLYMSFFWFYNAGTEGVIPVIWIGVYIMYLASASYKQYLFIVALVVINAVGIIYLEYLRPEYVFPYPTRISRYTDLQYMYTLILIGLGICIYFYKRAFEEERNRNERNSLILAESKSDIKVKKIIENSTDAVITTDSIGIVLEWNKSASKIFGFDVQEARGKKIAELIVPLSVKDNFENAVNYFKEKTNFIRFETTASNASGAIFPVELSMTQIEYEEKTLLNFFIRSIQERKESEEKILKKNKQLLDLNEEMDSFIYRSSHDLRTPATNISSLLEIYKVSDVAEKDEIIARSKSNIDRLIKILDDLSNYSKNQRNELSYQLINIDELLAAVKYKLSSQTNFDKLVVNTTEIGSYDFISDAERIKVILINLLENALCFSNSENEFAVVDIFIEKKGQKVLLRVKDNGEGIKQEALPKIFNMFYRGSVKSIGSGLGLYIVKRVLHKMGGTIEVHSQKGVGTEFLIEIPNNVEGILLEDTPTNEVILN